MNSVKCKVVLIGLLLALASAGPGRAQIIKNNDGTTLKQIIIFGRHSIRSSTTDSNTLAQYSANPYPAFDVPPGYLTTNGQRAASLLGAYFHDYLIHEGLLTDNPTTDLSHAYFRANYIERSAMTAAKFGEGLIPGGAAIPVHAYSLADNNPRTEPDPVFDPVLAKNALTVTIDPDRAETEVRGIYGSGAALTSAYSGELALLRSVLAPPGAVDPTAVPFTLTAYRNIAFTGGAISLGGLSTNVLATDPFVMEYANGFASEDVAWGRLTADTLSQLTRFFVLQMNIAMRSPYLNRLQSSNAGSHVLRSMNQAIAGSHLPGAFGDAKSQVLVIISSDFYVVGLAGLLGLHWTLPGYQPDFCPPGGALVFELRQSKTTKGYLVRAYFTAQTFEQLRNLTPLTLAAPPATMQLAILGGSTSVTNLDVKFATFKNMFSKAIDQRYVQHFGKEVPPGVLNYIP